MTRRAVARLRALEGCTVGLALGDGGRLDHVQLVSVPHGTLHTFWLFAAGEDLFIAAEDVIDMWECRDPSRSAA
jgi:hypothetical protein